MPLMSDQQPCWYIPQDLVAEEQQAAAAQAGAVLDDEAAAGAALYPPANHTTQWFGDTYPGVDMGGVDKVLLHTTETGSWPGYGGGASAPTLTYHPTRHEWRQHFYLHRSARALRDPDYTLVRENRDRVVQVEIICSSDRAFADRYGYPHVTELDDRALRDLGVFVGFMHDQYGVPLVKAPRWLSYPSSYGNTAARMTGPQFDTFRGVLGHQHASGNSHGDPGSINIDKIMAYAQPVPPSEDDLTPEQAAQLAHIAKRVEQNNQALGHMDPEVVNLLVEIRDLLKTGPTPTP